MQKDDDKQPKRGPYKIEGLRNEQLGVVTATSAQEALDLARQRGMVTANYAEAIEEGDSE